MTMCVQPIRNIGAANARNLLIPIDPHVLHLQLPGKRRRQNAHKHATERDLIGNRIFPQIRQSGRHKKADEDQVEDDPDGFPRIVRTDFGNVVAMQPNGC